MSRVAVVGGSLAGMAAAARLAKRGHEVTVYAGSLAPEWRPSRSAPGSEQPGPLPPVLTFPAPWRDLFKKSGRILPAELALAGLDLVPAPPVRHVFADGGELLLGGDRGEQFHRLARAYGARIAEDWRRTVDDLEPVWQQVRHLGLEVELADRRGLRSHRRSLLWGRTVADLAAARPHPHLRALVEEAAWRLGNDPSRTPAHVAARLCVERTFGRWMVVDAAGRPVGTQALLDLLEARLAARGVTVRPMAPDLPARLRSAAGGGAEATVWALDPAGLRRAGWHTRAIRGAARLAPALRPRTARLDPRSGTHGTGQVIETVDHATRTVRWDGPDTAVVHDWSAATPDPAAGPAWVGEATWLRRLPVRLAPGHYSAGAWGRGGSDLAAILMSGALATYAVHRDLTGEDIRPSNRDAAAHHGGPHLRRPVRTA